MSRSQSELSVSERMLLTFIRFKTNNNHQFYMGNEAIAMGLDIQPITAKSIVNKLVRKGYLIKTKDNKNRRHLALSGKEFVPITGNVANIDKKIAKESQKEAENWSKYCEQEKVKLTVRVKTLEEEIQNLHQKNDETEKQLWTILYPQLIRAEIRIAYLEQLFLNRNLSKDQLNRVLQENITQSFDLIEERKNMLALYLSSEELSKLTTLNDYKYWFVNPSTK